MTRRTWILAGVGLATTIVVAALFIRVDRSDPYHKPEEITYLLINDALQLAPCAFHKQHDRWPANMKEFLGALNDLRRQNGGEDLKEIRDAWKRPLIYRCPGNVHPNGYDIVSLGKDGVPSQDDIVNRDCPVDWPPKTLPRIP